MTAIRSMMSGALALFAALAVRRRCPGAKPDPAARFDRGHRRQDGHHRHARGHLGAGDACRQLGGDAGEPDDHGRHQENSFVGIASLKGPDGTLNALEVLIFREAARGSNEGHYPWDLQPESMMTNATVATVAAAPDGQTLTLGTQSAANPSLASRTGNYSQIWSKTGVREPQRRT